MLNLLIKRLYIAGYRLIRFSLFPVKLIYCIVYFNFFIDKKYKGVNFSSSQIVCLNLLAYLFILTQLLFAITGISLWQFFLRVDALFNVKEGLSFCLVHAISCLYLYFYKIDFEKYVKEMEYLYYNSTRKCLTILFGVFFYITMPLLAAWVTNITDTSWYF